MELKRQGATLEGVQSELSRVQAQLTVAQGEMENIKAVAVVLESTKQEAIDQVKGQWQEEVASLQAIMKGTATLPHWLSYMSARQSRPLGRLGNVTGVMFAT